MRTVWKSFAIAILAAAPLAGTAVAHDFSYNDVYLGYLKLAPPANVDQATDEYMQATQWRNWSDAKANELDWPNQAKKARENLKWLVGTFNINEPYELETDGMLGAYDTNTQSFEFDGLTANTFFSPTHSFGPDLKVSFLNTFGLSKIKVPTDVASAYLKKASNYRSVRLKINFVFVKSFQGTGAIKAKITALTVVSGTRPATTLATIHP